MTLSGETGVIRALTDEGKDDLLSRGYSRRHMLRAAMLVGGGAAAIAMHPEMAFAKPGAASGRIRIALNVRPTDDPQWLVPGIFYGENRVANSTCSH